MEFTIGKCPGSTPDLMVFIYNKIEKTVMIAWEHPNIASRDKMYNEICSEDYDHSEVKVYKGMMRNGEIILQGDATDCTVCKKMRRRRNRCVHG